MKSTIKLLIVLFFSVFCLMQVKSENITVNTTNNVASVSYYENPSLEPGQFCTVSYQINVTPNTPVKVNYTVLYPMNFCIYTRDNGVETLQARVSSPSPASLTILTSAGKIYVTFQYVWCGVGQLMSLNTSTDASWTTNNGSTLMKSNAFILGNLGVGTTMPKSRLESVSGVNAYPATSNTTTQTGSALRLRGGDNAVMDFGMNSVNTWIQATDQTNLSQNYNISLNPNGGNIGIGTTAPLSALNIKDNNARTSFTGTDRLGLTLQSSTTATSYTGLDFIGATNNVGNNPLARIAMTTTDNGSLLQFGTSNSWNGGITNTAMTIFHNGNVGIGTTDPNAKLDVAGNVKISDYSPTLVLQRNTNEGGFTEGIQTKLQDGTDNWFFGALHTGQWIVSKGNYENRKMTILENGNVGIGTTTPDALLSVKGTIHAQEVVVDLCSGLADFVFHPTYTLMPLPEVEQYVKTNSHLPQMPSAAEVSKNGLNMGEMQNKLLQKVEELTLYIIEQQKQIEALKKKLK